MAWYLVPTHETRRISSYKRVPKGNITSFKNKFKSLISKISEADRLPPIILKIYFFK